VGPWSLLETIFQPQVHNISHCFHVEEFVGPWSLRENFFQPHVHNISHCCQVEEFVGPWPLLGKLFPASGTRFITLLPRGGICGPMASVGETFFQPQVHNIAHCCHVEEFVGPWPLLGNLFPASGTQYTTLLPRGGICGPMASVGNPFPASCTQCTKLLPRGGIAGLMTFVINFFSLRYTVTHFCHEEEF
jgi:hypothetical protein